MEKIFDKKSIAEDYSVNLFTIEKLCKKYKIGKIRLKEILAEMGVKMRDRHFSRLETTFKVNDWSIPKYVDGDDYHWVAVSNDGLTKIDDIGNRGGHLTTYIEKVYGIETPTLYDRRKYYQQTGNYWWEQWFTVEKIYDKEAKKCPYCDWKTIDIENKSGAFEMHLKTCHNISKEDYLTEYPDDIDYFKKYKRAKKRKEIIDNDYVVCPICKKHFMKLTTTHLERAHGIKLSDFKKQYPDVPLLSKGEHERILSLQKISNLTVSKKRFISKYEREIREFLSENNIKFDANRQILGGKEIDILICDKKIGIEFDGLKWHTEWFGKKQHTYHLDKTIKCNEYGYGLIHIFEDEYVNHKEIVQNKILHILGKNNSPKIGGRKCEVREIYKYEAETFLNQYHIQGYSKSTVYLGAFYRDELIGVMSFKNGNIENHTWELARFATTNKYTCQGIGGKLFKYFIKKYNPEKVISFADRRWTLNTSCGKYARSSASSYESTINNINILFFVI